MAILAGDIGGTKTLLQLAEPVNGSFEVLYQKRYPSADYSEFLPLANDFVEEATKHTNIQAKAACFGIAGPVNGRTGGTTNLPWKLDADQLERVLGIPHVRLINDFQSVGYGIEVLKDNDIVTLQAGVEIPNTTRVVIGAGTGLGQGFLVWQNDHYEVIASEGGHADYAPGDDLQIELLQYLRKQYRWPTWERVVSGRGLVNIFEFLASRPAASISAELQKALELEDHAAAVSRFGLAGQDPLATQALDLFTKIYGAQAGNFALVGLATGGVYVAGGVAPKIIKKLQDGTFMEAFLDKYERMHPLLKAMPVRVVINEHVGLLGSAVAASRL